MGAPARHVVLFDAYPHSYTGTARSAHLLAQHLGELGHATEVVLPGEGIVADRIRGAGIAVTVVPVPASLGHYGRSTRGGRAARATIALPRYWLRLRRHLRGRADVVHVTSHRSVILAAPAARLARVPVLWQVSGIEDDRAVSRLCDLLATRTIAVSPAAWSASVRGSRPPTIVPPPLDPRFDGSTAVRPRWPPVVVTVGRLEPVKDHLLLLRAFRLVLARVPDARLRIIGGEQEGHADYADAVRRAAAELDGSVELPGWAERPEELWHDASVYVSTSRREGLGLAIVEAMSCGVPAVFTADTGLAGFVEPGCSALVVPAGDADAVADAIVTLLQDEALAAKVGAAGRDASRQFTLERVGAATASVIDEVTAGARR